MRGLSWPHRGPLTPGDAFDAGRADARRRLESSPLAASHHSCGLTPVWLKYYAASSGLTMIVAEQATEAVPPPHVPPWTTTCPFRRDEAFIAPLVIALCMVVGQVLVDHIIQHSHKNSR